MTGPEHYQVAETIAADVTKLVNEITDDGVTIKAAAVTALLALAQVHATLATAAATIDAIRLDPGEGDFIALGVWERVLG